MKCTFFVILYCGLFVMEAGSFLVNSTPKPGYEALNSQILKLKITQDQLQAQINHLRDVFPTSSPKGTRIAFQARQMKVNIPYVVNEVLKFDRLELNIGNAYNQNSGKFLVPVTGTYIFYANVMSYNKMSRLRAVLKTDDHGEIARAYTGSSLDYGTASITHTVQLNKGDHVWLTLYIAGNQAGHTDGNGYTYFGGLLLFS